MNLDSRMQLHTGRSMPMLGLGTWKLTHETASTVAAALKMGYPMIDTSGDYGTQPGIAKGIKQSGLVRDDFYLVTKIEEDEDAYNATKKNLKELGLDYADLMLIHRPPEEGVGEDLWDGLIRARREGLTLDIGVSNYSIGQLQTLIDTSDEVPVVNQVEWSPFGWDEAMLEFCEDHDIVIQAYSPLTRGERLNHPQLQAIGRAHKRTPAQILLRWSLQKGVVALPKANQIRHLRENLQVFDFSLSISDMDMLDNLGEEYSALGKKPVYLQS